MSTQAIPQIPPRPARAHDNALPKSAASAVQSNIPKIPPRPINRRLDRSQSPQRDSYARSPLNEPSFVASFAKKSPSANGKPHISHTEPPRRPPSVTLPSIGQEGNEYAEVFLAVAEPDPSPTQTRGIANDLQLYAPKPSLPISSAKQRVSAVTRTDSSQAAALGIGKANSDDKEPQSRSLKAKASNLSQNSSGTERPPSSSDSEHGIPEIGQRVPMYPNAGDVQAPSPSPFATQLATGAGSQGDGSKPRHHGRRTSARGFEGPPGSYGLHGHGIIPKDRFEQAYYEKHPDLLQKEIGQYGGAIGDGRGQWALSSEDLNKIVRETASRGAGLGTSPAIMGTPSEQIGFLASEEYASRISSPRPQPDGPQKSLTFQGRPEASRRSENDDVVHVEALERHMHTIYGNVAHVQSTDSLGPYVGTTSEEGVLHDEHGYSAPILASDEVAKDPFGYELQPAVSPVVERHGSSSADQNHHSKSESGSLPSSRPTSRPASIQGVSVNRYLSDFDREAHHTSLEDLDEYEPLFPEDGSEPKNRKVTASKDLNRTKLKSRKFPSQDVWEDAPNSLHYTATVSTPQLPVEEAEEETKKMLHVREGETPEQAFTRRQEELAEQEAQDSGSFLNREKSWAYKPHPTAETRPGMKQRFPSRDVWEDSPDSLLLETTVGKPQEKDIVSPSDEKPTTGAAIFHQELAPSGVSPSDETGRATAGSAAKLQPQIPVRPTKQKPVEKLCSDSPPAVQSASPTSAATGRIVGPPSASKPTISERSKPQVPVRPAKLISREVPENAPSTKADFGVASGSTGPEDVPSGSPFMTKSKPSVPTRPLGSKIAALQAGIMSDLNKRLQLGSQAAKDEPVPVAQEEEEKEKTPLVDARKGRARGPARRAPAKSPAPGAASSPSLSSSLSFSKPSMLWHIHPEEGTLSVPKEESASIPNPKVVQAPIYAPVTNGTGQSLERPAETTPKQKSHVLVNDDADSVAGSIEAIQLDEPFVNIETETGETVVHTNKGVGDEHSTAGTRENPIAYVGAALEDGDVVKEKTA